MDKTLRDKDEVELLPLLNEMLHMERDIKKHGKLPSMPVMS